MSRRKQLKPTPVKEDHPGTTNLTISGIVDNIITDCPMTKKRKLSDAEFHVEIDDKTSLTLTSTGIDVDQQTTASQPSNLSESSSKLDQFTCQLCLSHFDSISNLQMHTLKLHVSPLKGNEVVSTSEAQEPTVTSGFLECQHCSAVFSNFASFATHMRKHITIENGLEMRGSPIQNVVVVPESLSTSSAMMAASAQAAALLLEVPPCSICSATFTDNLSRLSHIVTHYETKIARVVCSTCYEVLPTATALKDHFTERHLSIRFNCTICNLTTNTQEEYQEHCLLHCQENSVSRCKICQKTMETRELLAIHIQLDHDRDSKSFEQHRLTAAAAAAASLIAQASLNPSSKHSLHSVEKSPDRESRILQCSVCDERCQGEDALDEHRLFSHCKIPRSDACAECSSPLRNTDDFERHTRMHTRDMYMHCAVCRQSLRSETQLLLHCRFHMTQAPSTYRTNAKSPGQHTEQQCEICSKVLISHDQLMLHLLEHDIYKSCPHCSLSFSLAHQLLSHVSELHSSESPFYKCDICEESFQFNIQLDHHKLRHGQDIDSSDSDSSSYACNQCDKSFQSITSLQSHSANHKEGAIRRCPICCLSFNTASRYENHVRKHVNTSCCVCQICGQGFNRRDELEQHMMVHKGNLEIGSRFQKISS